MKMKQKDAVYQAVVNVTGFDGEGVCVPTPEQRKQVNMILLEGFKSNSIELDRAPYETEAEWKSYVSGLQSNWLRKDTRLNGGEKYTAKNPGSRAGSSDPTLKALRALLTQLTPGTDNYNEIQAEISKHVSAIQATKQAKSIDYSALPEHLRIKFGK